MRDRRSHVARLFPVVIVPYTSRGLPAWQMPDTAKRGRWWGTSRFADLARQPQLQLISPHLVTARSGAATEEMAIARVPCSIFTIEKSIIARQHGGPHVSITLALRCAFYLAARTCFCVEKRLLNVMLHLETVRIFDVAKITRNFQTTRCRGHCFAASDGIGGRDRRVNHSMAL